MRCSINFERTGSNIVATIVHTCKENHSTTSTRENNMASFSTLMGEIIDEDFDKSCKICSEKNK